MSLRPLDRSQSLLDTRVKQPDKSYRNRRKHNPYRRGGGSEMRQDMNELELGGRVAMMPLGFIGVGVHDGHPVYRLPRGSG